MNRIRYDKYIFSAREFIWYLLQGIMLDGMISFLLYRSIIAFLILLPALYLFMERKKKVLMKARQRELNLQFREGIYAVSASIGAGYSVENAFVEAGKDLRNMYPADAPIVKEFAQIEGRLMANETIEQILMDLAGRSGSEDIRDFADVFVTAKRSGGELPVIIRRTSAHIGDKIEVRREIDTLMSAKKMEQNIMNIIPFFIILYVSMSSPGFLDVLYKNPVGITIMTVCLGLYLSAWLLAEKIVSIEV